MRWTDERCNLLRAMKAQGRTDREVAERLGHGCTSKSVSQKHVALRRNRGIEIPPQGRPSTYPAGVRAVRYPQERGIARIGPATAKALQARAALPEPASLTALVFGDPLPGRSALDQLRLNQGTAAVVSPPSGHPGFGREASTGNP